MVFTDTAQGTDPGPKSNDGDAKIEHGIHQPGKPRPEHQGGTSWASDGYHQRRGPTRHRCRGPGVLVTQTVLKGPLPGNPIKSGPGCPGGQHGFTERKKHISSKKKMCSETSCSPKARLQSASLHAPPAAALNQREESGLSLHRPTYVSIRAPRATPHAELPLANLGAGRTCTSPTSHNSEAQKWQPANPVK